MYSEEDFKHLFHVFQKDANDARAEARKYQRKFEHCRAECKKWKTKYLEVKKLLLDIFAVEEESDETEVKEYEPTCPLCYELNKEAFHKYIMEREEVENETISTNGR